jgi:hypothetical protein
MSMGASRAVFEPKSQNADIHLCRIRMMTPHLDVEPMFCVKGRYGRGIASARPAAFAAFTDVLWSRGGVIQPLLAFYPLGRLDRSLPARCGRRLHRVGGHSR